jgi:hypothetical protein
MRLKDSAVRQKDIVTAGRPKGAKSPSTKKVITVLKTAAKMEIHKVKDVGEKNMPKRHAEVSEEL